MIRHCVFVRFQPSVTPAARRAITDDLAALCARQEGAAEFKASANASPEGLDQGFAEGFSIDFTDAAARERYLENPIHKAIGGRIVAGAGGPEGLVVFDFQIA